MKKANSTQVTVASPRRQFNEPPKSFHMGISAALEANDQVKALITLMRDAGTPEDSTVAYAAFKMALKQIAETEERIKDLIFCSGHDVVANA